MKNAKRMLALAGMTLAAGAMLGIAPAQAAPAADQSSSTTTVSNGPRWDWDDEYVVGVYNNPWECRSAGRWGERVGSWEDYDCYEAWDLRWGRVWVLQVEEDDWEWDDWDGWRGDWPHRPHYMYGSRYHIGGAYSHPFRNRHGFKYSHLNHRAHDPWDRFNKSDRFDQSDRFDKIDKIDKVDKHGKAHKADKRGSAHKANKMHKTHKSPLGALSIQTQNRIPGFGK
ncbi:hypothetical protein [Actinoplanes sp. NPDC049802]|uniref:hypothetical protein n=1 Tax=Actinoplanes sp. NPDC049802 TaxID=3154742 RepID=UPI0033D823AE